MKKIKMQCKFVCSLFAFLAVGCAQNIASDKIDKHSVDINYHSSTIKNILEVLLQNNSSKTDEGEDSILKLYSENAKSPKQNETVNVVLDSYMNDVLCLHNETECLLSQVESNLNRNNVTEFLLTSYERNGSALFVSNPDIEDVVISNLDGIQTDDLESTILSNETIKVPEILTPYTVLNVVPPFDPRSTEGISEECKRQSEVYLRELKTLKLWALKMYDASAKIPSGFLNGNINQYGDIDQCIAVKSEGELVQGRGVVKGQYCLASLQLTLSANVSSTTKEIFNLVHSHRAFQSELRDPGHRVPRYSSISWALCVPSGCSHIDVQKWLQHVLAGQTDSAAVTAEVLVEPQMCQVSQDFNIPRGTIIVGCLFFGVILLSMMATIQEVNGQKSHEFVSSFSLKKNLKALFSLKRSQDDIKSVHGIRFLNAIMLLLSHKSMAIFFVPFMNRTYMSECLGQPWSVLGRAASLYTDPFIMFSGLLTCYAFIGRTNKRQHINIAQEYLGRLFRLVPTLGALILFCTWILPEMGSGPQWPLVISHHAHICKQHWWRNLLFIHNYFGFENMCLTHTHHIGIDTQLFAVGVPIALWLATRPEHRRKSVYILIFLATLSTVARFYVTYTMELANYVHFGTSVQQLFRTADYMYIIPAHRSTVYIMGLLLGLLLRHQPATRLTEKQLKLGWFSCLAVFLIAFLSPAGMGRVGYVYKVLPAASYAAFTPIAWCAVFGWIVYTQHHEYNSFIGELFSWRGFLIWTRLSYAVYLTQFPVFFYYVGMMRSSETYSFIGQMFNTKELIVIIFYSIVLTLLFDMPFQNIKNIICRPRRKDIEVPVVTYDSPDIDVTKGEQVSESIAIVRRNSNKKLWKAD